MRVARLKEGEREVPENVLVPRRDVDALAALLDVRPERVVEVGVESELVRAVAVVVEAAVGAVVARRGWVDRSTKVVLEIP